MSVTVVATIIPVPEHRAEVVAVFEALIPAVHANDEGCELYSLHEGEDRLVMIEKWGSLELLQAHGAGPLLKQLGADLDGKIIGGLDVQVLTPHPCGTPEQGTL